MEQVTSNIYQVIMPYFHHYLGIIMSPMVLKWQYGLVVLVTCTIVPIFLFKFFAAHPGMYNQKTWKVYRSLTTTLPHYINPLAIKIYSQWEVVSEVWLELTVVQ